MFRTEPDPGLNGEAWPTRAAKVIGGSSGHHTA